jgi:Tol biopolymer transport system component
VSQTGAIAYLSGGTVDNSELVWLDRSGRELGKIGSADAYVDVSLSPDGSRLAYSLTDRRSSTRDIWVRDLERDTSSRLTFDEGDDYRPVWSPDGTRIFFASDRTGPYVCMAKAANGMGAEEQIYKDKEINVTPESVSADGKWLVLNRTGPGVPGTVVVLPADGKGDAVTLPGTTAQLFGRISPDGRFIAYQSNETRTPEIYVQTWPPGGGKWQISNGGGVQPRWGVDGKDLFYRTPDSELYSAPVSLGPQFSAGIPKLLFKRRLQPGAMNWAIARDGQKFVMNAAPATASMPAFTVVLNWPEALAAK